MPFVTTAIPSTRPAHRFLLGLARRLVVRLGRLHLGDLAGHVVDLDRRVHQGQQLVLLDPVALVQLAEDLLLERHLDLVRLQRIALVPAAVDVQPALSCTLSHWLPSRACRRPPGAWTSAALDAGRATGFQAAASLRVRPGRPRPWRRSPVPRNEHADRPAASAGLRVGRLVGADDQDGAVVLAGHVFVLDRRSGGRPRRTMAPPRPRPAPAAGWTASFGARPRSLEAARLDRLRRRCGSERAGRQRHQGERPRAQHQTEGQPAEHGSILREGIRRASGAFSRPEPSETPARLTAARRLARIA